MFVMSLNCHREVSAKFKIPRRACWERPRAAVEEEIRTFRIREWQLVAVAGKTWWAREGSKPWRRDVLGGFESRQISPALGGCGEISRNSRVGV